MYPSTENTTSDSCCEVGQTDATIDAMADRYKQPRFAPGEETANPQSVFTVDGNSAVVPLSQQSEQLHCDHGTCKDESLPVSHSTVSSKSTTSAYKSKRNFQVAPEVSPDKPLPPRPALEYANVSTPSKRGRSLIDASEKPLRTSIGGADQDWPVINPCSTTAPTGICKTPVEPGSFATTQAPRTDVTATDVPLKQRAIHPCFRAPTPHHSPLSNNTSNHYSKHSLSDATTPNGEVAEENKLHYAPVDSPLTYKSTGSVDDPLYVAENSAFEHQRQYSIASEKLHNGTSRDRVSNGSVVTAGSTSKPTHFTDFSKPGTPKARSQSPSSVHLPTSRQNSGNSTRRISASSLQGAASNHGGKASRITIPGSRKNLASGVGTQESKSMSTVTINNGPAFGNRRLASPNALKLLDQGKKQLRQTAVPNNVDDNVSPNFSAVKSRPENATTALPDGPASSTSPHHHNDSQENSYGSAQNGHAIAQHPFERSNSTRVTNSEWPSTISQMFEEVDLVLTKMPPPSKSPYTEPLETIPSQAVLSAPLESMDSSKSGIEACYFTTEGRLPSDAGCTNSTIGPEQMTCDPQANPTAQGISALECDDELFDPATRQHLINTLSMFESQNEPLLDRSFGENTNEAFQEQGPRPTKKYDGTDTNFDQKLGSGDHDKIKISPNMTSVSASSVNISDSMQTPLHVKSPKYSTQLKDDNVSSETPSSRRTTPQHGTSNRKGSNTSIPTRNGQLSSTMKPLPQKPATPDDKTLATSDDRRDVQSNQSVNTGRQRFPPRSSSLKPPSGTPGSVKAAREKMSIRQRDAGQPTAAVHLNKPGASTSANRVAQHVAPEDAITPVSTPIANYVGAKNKQALSKSRTGNSPCGYSAEVSTQPTIQRSKSRNVLNKLNGLFNKREKKSNGSSTGTQPRSLGFPSRTDKTKGKPKQQPERAQEDDPERGQQQVQEQSPEVNLPTAPRDPGVPPPTHTRDVSNESPTIPDLPSGGSALTATLVRPELLTATETEVALLRIIEKMIEKARQEETSLLRKNSLLTLAKIFNDSLIQAREAQIHYENAKAAAECARISLQMVQENVRLLERLGEEIIRSFNSGRA